MDDASQPCSIGAALAWLRKVFRADAAAGLHVVYQVELAGEGGGRLWIRSTTAGSSSPRAARPIPT